MESVLVGKHCVRKAYLSDVIHVTFYTALSPGSEGQWCEDMVRTVLFICLIEYSNERENN